MRIRKRRRSNSDARRQRYQDAAKQVPSSNQDLQTVRDDVYGNCADDHGLPP
jgi:hypothetical protein